VKFTREHLTAFVCADCEPEDEAYFVAVSADVRSCPLDFCPRCGGYLSFTEEGKWLGQSESFLSWAAKQKEQAEA
jgi:hypothetical protein